MEKAGWRRVRARFVGFFKTLTAVRLFLLLLAVGELSFFVAVLIGGEDAFLSVFFRRCADQYMDFFHSLRDASRGAAVYNERRVIYPPLANAVLWLIGRALPDYYLQTAKETGIALWRHIPAAMLAYLFFAVLGTVLLALFLRDEPHGKRRSTLLALLLPLSLPLLFMLERGNIVWLALLPLLLYMRYYADESPVRREIGLLALALSAALKLYPAIFGLALLRDRRYADACRAALYALLLFVLPSFFFGGPFYCVYWLVKNTLFYSGQTGSNAVGWVTALGGSVALGRVLLLAAYLLLLTFAVIYTLAEPLLWRRFAVAGAALLTLSSVFSVYNWVLLLPALLLLLRQERLKGDEWVYFLALSLPFAVFLPKAWQDNFLVALLALMLGLASLRLVFLLKRGTPRRL